MPETHMIGELWICTKAQRDKYLNLMGYMFEQSIPLRGLPLVSTFTEWTTTERLHYAMRSQWL
jgi:hypothetical protein